VFGFSDLSEAERFRQHHGSGTIYRVSAAAAFQADMSLLFLGGSGIGALLYAMKYWGGEGTAQPRWEHLLVPPVTVIEHVTT
jgi:hypothetical protein